MRVFESIKQILIKKREEPTFQRIFKDPVKYLEIEHRVYKKERELILKDANIKTNMKVLDVGSGTGIWARKIVQKIAPNGEVIAVDISKNMIDRLNEEVAKNEGMALIKGTVGDVYNLPFRNSEFDCSFAGALFMYLREPLKALEELKRVTKEGGTITLTGDEDLNSWLLYPIDVDLWKEFLLSTRKVFNKSAEEDTNFWIDQYFARKYFWLFTKAGLRNITIKVYPYIWVKRPNRYLKLWLKENLSTGWNLIKDTDYLSKSDKEIFKSLFFDEKSEFFTRDDFFWQRCEYMIVGKV